MGERTGKRIGWATLMLYVLIAPAALQLLARLDEYFEFSGFVGRLLRAWSNFVHGLWERLLALLPQWIELSANQIDALAWCAAMVGASLFGPDEDEPERRASQPQAAILFWLAFAVATAIFLAPYFPALARAWDIDLERLGASGLLQSLALNLGLVLLAGVYLVSVVRTYRARHAGEELVPLWLHLEQVLGGFLLAGVIGWMLGRSELESAGAVERFAEVLGGGVSLDVVWSALLEPMAFATAFVFTVVSVRRNNWASMPRMIAAAGGVFAADRIIVFVGA